MRIRLPHPVWLVPIALIVGVSATVGHFWWKYRQTQALVAEVERRDGAIILGYNAPDWLVRWTEDHDAEPYLKFLKTDVILLQLSGKSFDDAWLRRLPRFRRIDTLDLSGSRVTDAGIAELLFCPTLRVIYLNETGVTDASLRALSSLPVLTTLLLEHTRITDAGVASLASQTNLATLSLADTAVTDAGVAALGSVKTLTSLDLTGTRVTDAGLAILKSLPQLGSLNLSHTDITDAGLTHLAANPPQNLTLTGTNVSREGINRLCQGRYRFLEPWNGRSASPLILIPDP